MNVKHSKYKNTGILFELLVRRVTADTLNEGESPALGIIQTYFVKSELGKEYKLYETLTKNTSLTEGKANVVLQSLLEASKRLNRSALKRQKYNLIKEIKKHYDIEEFFKTKLPNYKTFAAFYTLLEVENTEENVNHNQIVSNKITILEHLSKETISESKVENEVLQEFQTYDKDTRILAYRIIMEKFNDKYSSLHDSQKELLREYINAVDSTPVLRNFYNSKINEVRTTLSKLNSQVTDKVVKIKIEEVSSLLKEVDKTYNVTQDDVVNLLQYYELVEELKKSNG